MQSRHAEIDAFKKIKNHKKKNMPKCVDILVIKINKSLNLSESRPCNDCIKMLSTFNININKIYYSTPGGKFESENFHDMTKKKSYVTKGVIKCSHT